MKRRKPSEALFALVENYFVEYLGRTRGASQHTIRAYGDGLRLFLIYLGDRARRPVSKLTLEDIDAEAVVAFLNDLEKLRENTVATRNSRRAAIRGFVEHLLRHDLSRAEQYRRILAIPTKRARTKVICYLEPTEVRTIIAQPDISTAAGERDHALLLFLYNKGARISEALEVRWRDLRLRHPRQVELHGKGRKTRLCPLWPETTAALGRMMPESSFADDVVFRNSRGAPLTRDGAAYLIRKYAHRAAESTPHMRDKRVTPHVLRHSCAVALLQAGVDVSVIRDYLGHASVATTSRYISTNLEMRRAALEAFWETSGLTGPKKTKWKPSEKLLAFLTSL